VLREVSAEALGRPIEYDEQALARLLSARHFINVRTTPGGPAPSETARAIGASRAMLASDEAWRDGAHGRLARADERLKAASAAL
jgi:argininosuccinate lyase